VGSTHKIDGLGLGDFRVGKLWWH